MFYLTPVMPLVQPAKRVVLSNVPPFIKEVIERELSRHGKFVSKIRKISLGCKLPQYVVSFRRQVHMIINSQNKELNLSMQFRIEDFDCYFCYLRVHEMFQLWTGGPRDTDMP